MSHPENADTDIDRTLADALERVGHAARVLLRDTATSRGLSPLQVQLLLRLTVETPLGVSALARIFDITQPTVSDAVAALRRKGLVSADRPGRDRRRTVIALTEPGQRIADELRSWDAPVVAALADRPEPEKTLLLGLLLDLVGKLQRAGVIRVARTCVTCRFFRPDRHPGERAIHHCALMDAPLAPADLRVNCPEHERAAGA